MPEHVLCPECSRRLALDDAARAALEEKRGRGWELECADGHIFSLHDGMLATRIHPSHSEIFWDIQGVESGRETMRVGEWHTVRLNQAFEDLDEVKTICYPDEPDSVLLGVRSEARFDRKSPDHLWLMTSGDEAEWGETVCVHWTAYGTVPTHRMEVWRETLIFAARQLLAANYRPSVVQSAVAVESFVYGFVIDYLKDAGWCSKTIDTYVDASKSRDALSLNGTIQVCIREIMGLPIPEETWAEWVCLRKMRNALAHGNLVEYRSIRAASGQHFADEKARSEFAYRAAVQFIYDIRYPDGED